MTYSTLDDNTKRFLKEIANQLTIANQLKKLELIESMEIDEDVLDGILSGKNVY